MFEHLKVSATFHVGGVTDLELTTDLSDGSYGSELILHFRRMYHDVSSSEQKEMM